MIFTPNNVFLDSSILVEYFKENKTILLDGLLKNLGLRLCINSIVLSELSFHYIAYSSGKSPMTEKSGVCIANALKDKKLETIIRQYTLLEDANTIYPLYLRLMFDYNLLPNDALIIASCLSHGIRFIASHDSDFKIPCLNEGIVLLNQDTDFAQFI